MTRLNIKIDTKQLASNIGVILRIIVIPSAIVASAYLLSPRYTEWPKSVSWDMQLILEYLKVVTWPVFALIVIVFLKTDLRELLKRATKAKVGAASFDFAQPQEASELPQNIEDDVEAKEPKDGDNGLDAQTIEILTSKESKAAFDTVYDSIFGTQLGVLKRLRRNLDGLTADELADLYAAHTASTANSYPTFIAFIQWLLDEILVKFDAKKNRYYLTNAGAYFLQHLNDTNRYSLYKPW